MPLEWHHAKASSGLGSPQCRLRFHHDAVVDIAGVCKMAKIRLISSNGVETTYLGAFDKEAKIIRTEDGRQIHPALGDRIEVDDDEGGGCIVVAGVVVAVMLYAFAAILSWATEHPFLAIGGAIILIVIIAVLINAVRKTSSTSATTPATIESSAGDSVVVPAPPNARAVRILIASPRDMTIERDIACEVVSEWNNTHSTDFGVVLHPVRWETESVPQLGDRAQAVINKQLVEGCDALVGLFWTRLGTVTGAAESGTVEEVDLVRVAGKPVMLYFSVRPISPPDIDFDQYKRLTAFRNRVEAAGLVEVFSTHEELRRKMLRHLSALGRSYRAHFGSANSRC